MSFRRFIIVFLCSRAFTCVAEGDRCGAAKQALQTLQMGKAQAIQKAQLFKKAANESESSDPQRANQMREKATMELGQIAGDNSSMPGALAAVMAACAPIQGTPGANADKSLAKTNASTQVGFSK